MKKDTRFSIRKLTVGVASIAVASFLASGTVDAANLSILDSRMDEEGHNPELPFEPFPPSISYTQPEAPWMQGSVDTEVPGDDVEDVTEPRDPNYEDPEAPFAPVEDVTEPRDPNYEDPEAPFAPVEDVTEPRDPNYEDPEAPFAPVEEDETEVIPGTIIEPGYKKTLVGIEYPAPSEESSENVATTRSAIETELKDVSEKYALGLKFIIDSPRSGEGTEKFYQPYYEAASSDQGQTILADYLDYYRKAKEDETITLEQLVLDSVGKKGGIYETLTVAAAKKLGVDGVEEGQEPSYYKNKMASESNLYKKVKTEGNFNPYGSYAPRKEAQEAVNKVYADMTDLLKAGTAAYRAVTGNNEATENDALAAGLDYYRTVANKPEATLKDVVEELAQFGFNTNGALELAKQYAKEATSLGDVTEHYKETMGEKIYKYIQDETGKILEGIGEGN